MTSQIVSATTTNDPVKAKHRAMWALGDYPAVAAQLIPELGVALAQACAAGPGQQILDVAAGSGNAAIPAALAGASVTASDLTPELLESGARLAEEQGVTLRWEVGDVEALPYDDASFDTVMSCVGAMFAPRHQTTADEMLRTLRPGGRLGLISWTPQGFIGQMLATMKPYLPAPTPGAQPPPLWGDEDHVRALFGDRVTEVSGTRQTVRMARFADGAELRDYFKANYGPTIAVYRNIADDPSKVEALDRALVELVDRFDQGDAVTDWEYLLFTARKA